MPGSLQSRERPIGIAVAHPAELGELPVSVVEVPPACNRRLKRLLGRIMTAQSLLATRQNQPGFRCVKTFQKGGPQMGLSLPPTAGVAQRASEIVLGHRACWVNRDGLTVEPQRLLETAGRLERMGLPHQGGGVGGRGGHEGLPEGSETAVLQGRISARMKRARKDGATRPPSLFCHLPRRSWPFPSERPLLPSAVCAVLMTVWSAPRTLKTPRRASSAVRTMSTRRPDFIAASRS